MMVVLNIRKTGVKMAFDNFLGMRALKMGLILLRTWKFLGKLKTRVLARIPLGLWF